MTLLIPELLCARCQHRFWPAEGAESSAWIFCPRCEAAHANAAAGPEDAAVGILNADYGAGAEAVEWLRRHWAGPPPRCGTPRAVDTFESGVHRGYRWCRDRSSGGPSGGPGPRLIISAYGQRPEEPHLHSGGLASVLGRGGLEEKLEQGVSLIEARGGRPCFERQEVEHPSIPEPEPETRSVDESLESERWRCTRCGAPQSAIGLVGDTECAYCGGIQALPERLSIRLARYRRELAARAASVGDALRPERLWASGPRRHPALSCVYCGAPTAYRSHDPSPSCASCGGGLLPPQPVLDRGLLDASSAVAARAGELRAEARRERLRVDAAVRRQGALMMVAWLAPSALCLAGLAAVGILSKVSYAPLIVIGAPLVMAVGGLAALAAKRRSKARKWRSRLEPLARQLGATGIGKLDALQSFLARWWHDAFPLDRHGDGESEVCLVTSLGGFPVAVEAETEEADVGFRTRRPSSELRAQVVVAAALPRFAAGAVKLDPARPLVDALAAGGFDVG